MGSDGEERVAFAGDIPVIGLGTWMLTGDDCSHMVSKAIEFGYRHVDTAEMYKNEEFVGQGIKDAHVPREELFLTSKVWKDNLREKDVVQACEQSLRKLGVDYLDLYLIHWPNKSIPLEETFKGLKRLLDEGKIKSVGVSNFNQEWLKKALVLAQQAGVSIRVNQVEYHPFLNQESLRRLCELEGVQLVAYSPLARGKVLENSVLKSVGITHAKTPAQVSLKWLLQKNIVAIPKSSSVSHLLANMDILDFDLSDKDMKVINTLHSNDRLINPSFAEF